MLNNYIIQSHLTMSTSKGLKVREAAVFISPYDIRLKYFKEISVQLQHDQYVLLRDLPDNTCDATGNTMNNVAIPKNEEYCNAINYFMNEDVKSEKIIKMKQ